MKRKPIREPCDWWFHSGPTTDEHGNQIPKGPFYCANKKSENHEKTECPRATCPDYTIHRNKSK